jgi:amino acid transporter
MSTDLEKPPASPPSDSKEAPIEGTIEEGNVAEAGDNQLLAQLGYKQELKRQYSTVQIFAIAFSIMALLPSIASTLSFSIPAGPVGMVWGWLVASFFILLVGLAMVNMIQEYTTHFSIVSC